MQRWFSLQLHERAFLSVTSEAPKSRFPHWKGVEIETATLPAYGIDTPFVGLPQLPNSASDIFEIVVEDLRSQYSLLIQAK